MNINYPKIVERLHTIDEAPIISLLMSGIEGLTHQLKGETLPQFDSVVLKGYDPLRNHTLRSQEFGGDIYHLDGIAYTRSHLLDFVGREQKFLGQNREQALRDYVARIESDRTTMGKIGADFVDYKLRRTTVHILQDAEEEIPRFLRQAELNPLLALVDCSSHLQTCEKSLHLAKVMLEGRIEEVKSAGGERYD